MDDLKEEILAAVAQAIAGLRREHVAETEALRAEASELRRELNDMRAQKDAAEREAEDKFQQLMEVSKRLTEAGDATIELVAASRKELDDALAAVRADVSTKAPAEDLVAVWDSLTDYAQCPDVAKSIGAVNELVQEVRSSTLRDRDEVLGEIAALPDADALFAEAREQMDILHRAALAKVDDAVASMPSVDAFAIAMMPRVDIVAKNLRRDFDTTLSEQPDVLKLHADAIARAEELHRIAMERVDEESKSIPTAETIEACFMPLVNGKIAEATGELRPMIEGRITREQLEEQGAVLAETMKALATVDDYAELRAAINERATVEQLVEVQEALVREVGTKATPKQVAEAVEPLATRAALTEVQEALTREVATKATPEQVAGAVEPLATRAALTGAQDALVREIGTKATPEQVAEAVESLATRAALVEVQDALTREVATKATPEQVAEAVEPLATRAALTEAQDALTREVATKATPAQYDALVERVRNELVQRYTAAEDWLRGGAGYQAFSLCKHDGALWQSVRATTSTPGLSEDWILLADGLSTITFKPNGPQHVKMVAAMSSGRIAEHTFKTPVPRFRGVYVPGGEYEAWDTVAKDSHVFLCLRDAPTASPGEVQGEWQVFSGPRGKTGKPADEKAIKLSIMRELVPQIQEAVDAR